MRRAAQRVVWGERHVAARLDAATVRVLPLEDLDRARDVAIAPSAIAFGIDPQGEVLAADLAKIERAGGPAIALRHPASARPDAMRACALVFDHRARRLAAAWSAASDVFADADDWNVWDAASGEPCGVYVELPAEPCDFTVALADDALALAYRTQPYATEYGSAGSHGRGWAVCALGASRAIGPSSHHDTYDAELDPVAIAIDPSARWLVVAPPKDAWKFDLRQPDGEVLAPVPAPRPVAPGALLVARDGTTAALRDGVVYFVPADGGEPRPLEGGVAAMALAPDGDRIAVLGADGALQLRRLPRD